METLLGLAGLFAIMIVQVIVPPIPAELIVLGAGKTYGVWTTTLVAGSGLFVGSVAVYWIGISIQQKFRRFFDGEKIRKILGAFKEYGAFVLWIRILPYNPSDAISYAAGMARVPKKTFYAISLVTSFIRCALLAWFGENIRDLKDAFAILTLLLLSALIAWALLYRKNRKPN